MLQNTNSQRINNYSYSELIRNLFTAVDTCNWKYLAEIYDNEILYERPGYSPFISLQRLLQFYETERIIAAGKHHIEHITIEGNYGACWGRFIGISKNGSEIDEFFADVYSFVNGKIKTRKTHFFRPAV